MRLDARNAGTAQTLPILVFDERRLTPSFGYVFKPQWLDPHESIVSILWKFATMNGLSGHMVATQVAKTTIDPYDGIDPNREAVDIRRLRQSWDYGSTSCGCCSRPPWSVRAADTFAIVRSACCAVITAFCINWNPCSNAPCTAVGCKQTVGTATNRRRIESMRGCWIRHFVVAIVDSPMPSAHRGLNIDGRYRVAR